MTTDPAITATYAYATDDVEIGTIEIRHPLIEDDQGNAGVIRLAAVFAPPSELELEPYWEARLEADAPMNAGEIVPFIRAPITVERPERSTTGVPQATIRTANADARIGEALTAVARSAEPARCTVRVFTEATRLGGQPDVLDGLDLVDPEVNVMEVTVRAQGPDVVNTLYQTQRYDSRFPLLGL